MILKGFSPTTTALRRIAEVVWELPRDAVPKGGEDPSKVRMRSDLEVFQDVHSIRCVEEENPGIQLKQRNVIFLIVLLYLFSPPFGFPPIQVSNDKSSFSLLRWPTAMGVKGELAPQGFDSQQPKNIFANFRLCIAVGVSTSKRFQKV